MQVCAGLRQLLAHLGQPVPVSACPFPRVLCARASSLFAGVAATETDAEICDGTRQTANLLCGGGFRQQHRRTDRAAMVNCATVVVNFGNAVAVEGVLAWDAGLIRIWPGA